MTKTSPPTSSDNGSSNGDILHTPSSSLSPNPPLPPPSRTDSVSPLWNSSQSRKPEKKHHPDYFERRRSDNKYEEDDLNDSDALELSDMIGTNDPAGGLSHQPLLQDNKRSHDLDDRPPSLTRRSTFSSRSPRYSQPVDQTRRKYIYAAFFLVVSLVSFVVQTETAVYIQHELHWNKAYCMLWLTHGSWSLLYPTQLLILRIQKRKQPWSSFWRHHKSLVRTTAQMIHNHKLHLSASATAVSPWPYLLRTTAYVTTFLTFAGASWYVAVNLTSPSDLTAIYNCSAFFAYVFSILLLKEKARLDKILSVGLAVAGVLVVAYGDKDDAGSKSGGHSGGSTNPNPDPETPPNNRLVGNLVIGIGSVLYGLYEVLYKKYACPPEGTNPTRGMIFANTFGSMIGLFTLTVLWIPLPILHFTGLEIFELPRGKAAALLAISTLSNAVFSGAFLILMSLTSPVLSSVAALLTIFLVAITDWLITGKPLSAAAIGGGGLIIVAFCMLSWATYREMSEEARKRGIRGGGDEDEDGEDKAVDDEEEDGLRRSEVIVRGDADVVEVEDWDDESVGGRGWFDRVGHRNS